MHHPINPFFSVILGLSWYNCRTTPPRHSRTLPAFIVSLSIISWSFPIWDDQHLTDLSNPASSVWSPKPKYYFRSLLFRAVVDDWRFCFEEPPETLPRKGSSSAPSGVAGVQASRRTEAICVQPLLGRIVLPKLEGNSKLIPIVIITFIVLRCFLGCKCQGPSVDQLLTEHPRLEPLRREVCS